MLGTEQQQKNWPIGSLQHEREAAARSDWILIHTQPAREFTVVAKLNAASIPTFLPLHSLKRASGKYCPLFPSYVMAKFPQCMHPEVNSMLSRLPYLGQVVYFGSNPALLPPDVIEKIAMRLDENGVLRIGSAMPKEFHVGERVVITDGPFKGLNGVFTGTMSGKQAGWVLISGSEQYTADFYCGRKQRELRVSDKTLTVNFRDLSLA